jgi:hypothetical protein
MMTALVAVATFLLGLRLGLALGHYNERRRLARARKEEGLLSRGD